MRHASVAVVVAALASACTMRHRVRGDAPLPPSRVDRVVGAFQGAGIGIVAGGATGAMIGYTDGDDAPCAPDGLFCFTHTAKEKAILGAFGGGFAGALAGLAIGAIVGQRDVYERQPIVRLAPTSGGVTATAGLRF